MGKPYNRQYLDAATSSCGTMQCAACGQPITSGQFRAAQKTQRDGDWAYVTHHRACSESDPGWAAYDQALERAAAYEASATVWLRDLDGTGSMHVCAEGDPGATEYRRVEAWEL